MEQKESFVSRSKDFLKQQGFYIVLALCLLIVGAAIALTALPREGAPQQAAATPQQPSQAVVESRQSGDQTLAAVATASPSPSPAPAVSITPTPAPEKSPAATSGRRAVARGQAPVEGEIIWSFATDALLYSATLDQWTTHPGVDIACDEGTEVRAVLAGTVRRVYSDDALGQVVEIEHTNGRVSLYANLSENLAVLEGKKVNAGEVIGVTGSTALSECGALPHLHLGFFVDDKPVDPAEYVTLPH